MLGSFFNALGLKENEEQRLDTLYDNFQRPPKIDIAMRHAAATKFAKTDTKIDLDNTNVCPCCGLPTVIEELPLCASRNEFSFNGSGIALYFDFLVFSGVMVLTYMYLLINRSAIACGYNLYQNSVGQRCENLDVSEQCYENFYNKYSLTNDNNQLDPVRSLLNFVFLVTILFMSLFYRRHINKIAMELDDAAVLASDYSIFVENIPRDAKEEEIRDFFSQDFQNQKVELRKLCMAYEIKPYLELDKQKNMKETVLTRILEMEAAGKPIPKSIPSRLELQKQIKQVSKELDDMEDHRQTIFDFSGVCIITYNYEKQADYVCQTFKATRFQLYLEQLGFKQDKFLKFRNNSLFVRKAPEPGDIIWGNLGITVREQFRRTFITNCMTILLLLFGFGCLIGLSYLQTLINNDGEEISLLKTVLVNILGVVSSILIAIINSLLAKMIIRFAELEQNATKTDYDVSVASKMGIAQFLNTAILTLIIDLIIKHKAEKLNDAIWKPGGLNADVILIFITNAIVPWLTQLLDINYFYKIYVRNKIIIQGENCKYTQSEANKAFEGPSIDLSQKYPQLTKTLMLSFLYAPLLPLGICFTFFSIICTYWAEKYLLLRRDSKPAPTGSAMAEAMIEFYVELIFLLFSLGCVFWEWINYRDIHILTWIQLGLSAFYYIVPIEKFFGCIVDLGIDNATTESYDEKYLNFYDDYDRKNPVTADAAKEKWIKLQKDTVHVAEASSKLQQQLLSRNNNEQYHLIQHQKKANKVYPEMKNTVSKGIQK